MNYYKQIKSELINNEAYKRVKDYSKNRSDLRAYYNVGKLLIKAQGGEKRAKYGDKIIKKYATKLTLELGRQYNWVTLTRMRKFYLLSQKVATLSQQLTWSHYVELLKFDNLDEVQYYLKLCENNSLSVRDLRERIKNKDYQRLPVSTRKKLAQNKPIKPQDTVKDPIMIRNSGKYDEFSEKVLQQLILEDIEHFLKELGDGFAFISSEYKIKIGKDYHYIDLLLGNLKFNCYVVIELKITEFKAEYIGQIQKYMNYVDKNLKDPFQSDTIGIVIARRGNQFVLEYCSDPRVKVTTWRAL